jgi:hypothetical protein
MKSFLLLGLVFSWASAWSSTDLSFQTNTKEPKILSVLEELNSELPEGFKKFLPSHIKLEFKNLNGRSLEELKCESGIVIGRKLKIFKEEKIEIDNVFIQEILRGDRSLDCENRTINHSSVKKYFKATVAHELAHLYDSRQKVSDNPFFLNLSGWMRKGMIIRRKTNLNQREERTPDAYELKNAKETFAVNFEHYLYDENFGCRRPTYFEFLNNEFGLAPQKPNCQMINQIFVTDSNGDSVERSMDADRLYQVHYLFAGKGDTLMSRFGHSMFRLVFCAPGRPKGIDCLKDVQHHVVISFRANVTDPKISYIDGVKGEYPSEIFFLPLPQVVNEYTKRELREVHSLPLRMSEDELNRFLMKSKELFWGYQGRYYFFTNNCATESMNLLKVALRDHASVQKKVINTPNGMYNFLVKTGLGDDSVFKNLKEAEKKSLYFPSASEKMKNSLENLGIKNQSFDQFMEQTPQMRMNLYLEVIQHTDQKIKLAANALRIEDMILESNKMRFAKLVADLLFNAQASHIKGTRLEELVLELQKMQIKSGPVKFLAEGYGIPLVDEVELYSEFEKANRQKELQSKMKELEDYLKDYLADELANISETAKNRVELIRIISAI